MILRRALSPLLLVAALACSGGYPGDPVPPPGNHGLRKGVVLGLFARRDAAGIRRDLEEIRALGATSVCIVIPWVTPDVRSTEIRPRADMTPGDDPLRLSVRLAHRLGMSVLMMPIVYVDRMAAGEWRGTIDPPDWQAWFGAYGEMILRYARLAADERAEMLSVGSELCSTEGRRREWLDLIGKVRAIYAGRLTYSANWDHRESLSFAGALDDVGMNAYFELSRDPGATVEDLVRAWRPILSEVAAWREGIGKPLILTEVGYPSRRGAAVDPWDYAERGSPDPESQERAYRAFTEAWTGFPHLAGVYFYLWWGSGGPADPGYTPRGKPAENVLREWFASIGKGASP